MLASAQASKQVGVEQAQRRAKEKALQESARQRIEVSEQHAQRVALALTTAADQDAEPAYVNPASGVVSFGGAWLLLRPAPACAWSLLRPAC